MKTETMKLSLDNITVRMYRTGFGDCFLFFFNYIDRKEKENKKKKTVIETKRLLIDFGAWKPQEDLFELNTGKFHSLQEIGEAIKKALNGNPLDAVVITHEHKDHLNGFKSAEEIFQNDDGIKISEIWMSWIENLDDKEAEKLKTFKKSSMKAVEKAMNKLTALNMNMVKDASGKSVKQPQFRQLEELLSFEDGDDDGSLLGVVGRKGNNQLAMDVVKNACAKKPIYYEPGQIIEAWEGVRFYVLGPPKDEMALYTDESKKEGDLYLSAATLSEDEYSFLYANFDNGPINNREQWIKNAPFDEEFINLEAMVDQTVLQKLIPESENIEVQKSVLPENKIQSGDTVKMYNDAENSWRKIDTDWLGTAERLAIKLNSHTNNTSLALAIEMIEADAVLLFPGDAQFGNWDSWKKVEFKLEDKNKVSNSGEKVTRTIKSEDLLKKAVLYKVGHHASHNATANSAGLELMKDSLKISLIPVARNTAKGNDWPIPHPALLKRMESFTNHGVIMADFTKAEKAEFEQRMKNHKGFVDCTFDADNMFIEIKIANKKNTL